MANYQNRNFAGSRCVALCVPIFEHYLSSGKNRGMCNQALSRNEPDLIGIQGLTSSHVSVSYIKY